MALDLMTNPPPLFCRINGQYIMEGLASSFMFTLGGLGFIVLDQTHKQGMPSLNRMMLQVGLLSSFARGEIITIVAFRNPR